MAFTYYDFINKNENMWYDGSTFDVGRESALKVKNEIQDALSETDFGVSDLGYWDTGHFNYSGAGFVVYLGEHEWFFGFATTQSATNSNVGTWFNEADNRVYDPSGSTVSSGTDVPFIFGYNDGVGSWDLDFDSGYSYTGGDMTLINKNLGDEQDCIDFLPHEDVILFDPTDNSYGNNDGAEAWSTSKIIFEDSKPFVNVYSCYDQNLIKSIVITGGVIDTVDENDQSYSLSFIQEINTTQNNVWLRGGILSDDSDWSDYHSVTRDYESGDFYKVGLRGHKSFKGESTPIGDQYPSDRVKVVDPDSIRPMKGYIDPSVLRVVGASTSPIDLYRSFDIGGEWTLVRLHSEVAYPWPKDVPVLPLVSER